MKKTSTILIIAALLLSVAASAQPRSLHDPNDPNSLRPNWEQGRTHYSKINHVKMVNHQDGDLHWTCVEVNSGVNIMITRDKSQVYLGNSKKNSHNGWLRIGSGLCRTLDGPRTIFYSGGWKNDMRHGEGITFERGGDCTWSKWRYGNIVKDSTREATEAEKEELEEKIKDMESFLPYIN